MDLHLIEAVLERVGDAHGRVRQLALLADRDEARAEPVRHGAAENEAPGFDPGDPVHPRVEPRPHELIDRVGEGVGIAEKGGDVPEHDAGAGVVRNRPDGGFQVHGLSCCHARARYVKP